MLSKHIILVFCGEGYLEATNSLRILSISLIFAVLACFYINVVMLPNSLEKKILIATTISAVCNIFLNLILIPRLGIDAAALTTLISEIIMTALGIYYTKEKISYKIIKGIAVSVLNTLVTIILCRQVLQKVTNLYVAILFAVLLSIICFSIITFLAYRKTCKAIVSKCICKL